LERVKPRGQEVSWAEKYRPNTTSELVGNEEVVAKFYEWLGQWGKVKKASKGACLLIGPPGVGKTTLARAAAFDFGYRIVEMNASDVRTEKAIEAILGPASQSVALDSFYNGSRGNLVLLDEVDGVFGREDRGGLGAILSFLERPPIPIVLTANTMDEDRFGDLLKACWLAEMNEIRPRVLVSLLNHILAEEGKSLPIQELKRIAESSHGDIRSAINDLQALAAGRSAVGAGTRTRETDEKETLRRLFSQGNLAKARRALDETEIPLYRDELLLLLHDLLPYLYTSPEKLARATEALARADMGYGRINAGRSRAMMPPPFNMPRRDRPPNWSTLPFVLAEIASLGNEKTDTDVDHALSVAPRLSETIPERYQYRLWEQDRICSRIAKACHLSKKSARSTVLPFLIQILSSNAEAGREIASWLGLEERDIAFVAAEAKQPPAVKGPEQVLDPHGFRLPYMGKDKFIQLMRAGLSYDRRNGIFVVRNLAKLEQVEEQVSQITGKPIRFSRPTVPSEIPNAGEIRKECYLDGTEILCKNCEFIESCQSYQVVFLNYCLCDESYLDPEAWDKYVAKRRTTIRKPSASEPKRKTRRRRTGAKAKP